MAMSRNYSMPRPASRRIAPLPLLCAVAALAGVLLTAPGARAQQDGVHVLDRLNALEQSVKDVRNQLEKNEARNRKAQGNANEAAKAEAAKAEAAKAEAAKAEAAKAAAAKAEAAAATARQDARLTAIETRLATLEQKIDALLAARTAPPAPPAATPSPAAATTPEDAFKSAQTKAARAMTLSGEAQQKSLAEAEKQFADFIAAYPGHARIADAHYWLGRVQHVGGRHQDAANTFSVFQTRWSDDPRFPEATLLMAESVTKFAAPAMACAILDNLPELVPDPGVEFLTRLTALKESVDCDA